MNVVIIEDEPYAALGLERILLSLRSDIIIVKKIAGVEEGIAYFQDHPEPDLLFCDIQLSDGNSFDIFKVHPIQCPVVFTTAYDEFALKAFELNSINYLLKPIKKEEVERTLKKFEVHFKPASFDFEKLEVILSGPTFNKRFVGKIGQTIQVILVEDIAFFLSEDGVTFIYDIKGKRFITDYSLNQLETLLNPEFFFRVNRQLIVHIQSIAKVEPYFKGRLLLYLHPDLKKKQTISQEKAGKFKDWVSGG